MPPKSKSREPSAAPKSRPTSRAASKSRAPAEKEAAPPSESVGKKRQRKPPKMPDEDGDDVPQIKRAKPEAKKAAPKPAAKPPKKPAAKRAIAKAVKPRLVKGPARTLTDTEEQIVVCLSDLVKIAALEFSKRSNRLNDVYAEMRIKVKSAQELCAASRSSASVVDTDAACAKEEDTKLPPYAESIDRVMTAIDQCEKSFSQDEVAQLDFDEDLIHPVAYAALSALNDVEGFASPAPPRVITEKLLAQKAKRIEEVKAKRDTLEQKAQDKQKKKDEKTSRAEGRGIKKGSTNDFELKHLRSIESDIIFAPLPIPSRELFERALRTWCMIASLPQILKLSQFSFDMFCKALKDTSNEHLCHEAARALCVAQGWDMKATSRSWLASVAKFIETRCDEIESGARFKEIQLSLKKNRLAASRLRRQELKDRKQAKKSGEKPPPKKKKKPQAKKVTRRRRGDSTSEDDDSSDDDDSDDSDEDEDSSDEDDSSENSSSASEEDASEEEEEDEEAQEEEEEAEETEETEEREDIEEDGHEMTALEREARRAQTERLKKTRALLGAVKHGYHSWTNCDLEERIQIFEFLVDELLTEPSIAAAATDLEEEVQNEWKAYHAKCKQYQEDLKDGLKKLDRKAEGFATQKAKLVQKNEDRRASALISLYEHIDHGDVGQCIVPLGEDRYGRTYWHFPLDRHISVQSNPHRQLPGSDYVVSPGVAEPSVQAPSPDMGKGCESGQWGSPKLLQPEEEKADDSPKLIDIEQDIKPKSRSRASREAQQALAMLQGAVKKDDEPIVVDGPIQRDWGYVPYDNLESFIAHLDDRGFREHALKNALVPYVTIASRTEDPTMSGGMTMRTRRMASNQGYVNKFSEDSITSYF